VGALKYLFPLFPLIMPAHLQCGCAEILTQLINHKSSSMLTFFMRMKGDNQLLFILIIEVFYLVKRFFLILNYIELLIFKSSYESVISRILCISNKNWLQLYLDFRLHSFTSNYTLFEMYWFWKMSVRNISRDCLNFVIFSCTRQF
jgi:hypothetical protein